jgi:hypothetical protein
MSKFSTYCDSFLNARLMRCESGVLGVALHTDGSTLIFNGYTHEQFVDLFHAKSAPIRRIELIFKCLSLWAAKSVMETFVRIVEMGSFWAAARHMNVGQPAVSKSVAQLEQTALDAPSAHLPGGTPRAFDRSRSRRQSSNPENSDAAWNDWAWSHGRQHGSAPDRSHQVTPVHSY